MNIKVTTTKVEIDNESLNKGEYNIRECNFELAEEFTGLVCKALFTISKTKLTYEQSIVNGKCNIPYEATLNRGKVIIGVIGYEVENEELIKRYSPEPDEFFVLDGSYVEDIENQSTPTPSDLEQLEQRVSAIEIDAEQVEINTQNISDLQENKADKSELEDFITKDVNDLTYYTLTTQTGSQIELTLNSTNFKMTATLKDKNGTVVNTSNEIDLPLESVVVNASYDSTTKELVLTLQNGTTVRVSIADLVSGLVSDTDYATASKGGVIKVSISKGTSISNGVLTAATVTYENYGNLNGNGFISKGTLDNVITGKQLVNETQLNTKADKSSLVTGSGENITLQNTAELEFIQPPLPGGNSEQDGEPSPTNEVPITNVTGDVEVLVQNKNLFDGISEPGYYNSSGIYYNNASNRMTDFYQINENIQITASVNSGFSSLTFYYFNKNKNYISSNTVRTNKTSITDTTPAECKYIKFGSNLNNSTMTDTTLAEYELQIEQSSTATTYTPHKEQTYTFPLGTQRMYLGDYLADDGIHHVRKQIELTSNENWVKSGVQTSQSEIRYDGYTNAYTKAKTAEVLCTHFKYNGSNQGGIWANSEGVVLALRIQSADFSTVEDLRTWLSTHNVTVEYELATEEITPYTTEQQQAYDEIKQALSYEEQTNISGTSDESNPLFEVQAVQYKEPDYWTIAYVNGQIGDAIGGAY